MSIYFLQSFINRISFVSAVFGFAWSLNLSEGTQSIASEAVWEQPVWRGSRNGINEATRIQDNEAATKAIRFDPSSLCSLRSLRLNQEKESAVERENGRLNHDGKSHKTPNGQSTIKGCPKTFASKQRLLLIVLRTMLSEIFSKKHLQ